ncbi:flagellar basal body P-ring formation chaperone FlgA [Stappia sp. 28M-7]|uniref:flagellar basal body P-ring formation chaperone FlgA n=1 Tax=Stappia sp. 28M-7 TaxID=2762596 RepID=UPI00163C2293|nr:flagellar basal body P-ring formation chaperone FlgA [Stappia sp. 28M-7]MBC2860322.1 flagellar basal body P-ring formation protein FlgA [Stappia sp. 28M-7]
MFARLLLAAALVATAALPALAGTLRSEVAVTGPVVTIGDFYPDAGAHAATPLFRAPDAGTRGTVPAHMVAERAREAGYATASTDGLRQVVVERLALTIGEHEVTQAVRDALLARESNLEAESLDVTLTGFRGPLLADAGQVEPINVSDLAWDRYSGRLSTTLRIRTVEGTTTVRLTGVAREMVDVYVAARPIERGTIIAASDIEPQRVPGNRLTARQITDPAQIIGQSARQALQVGRPLRAADFEPPVLVRRGAKVTLVYRAAGMTLTTVGQAMSNGAAGDMIDVLNLQSRRTVTGIVRARDQIEVGFARQHLAQLQETN